MSLFAKGVVFVYNYFSNTPDSFEVPTRIDGRQEVVTVQPEAGDTIEALTKKIRDRVQESGLTWDKRWMPLSNPTDLEKEFDEAIEWTVAYAKFEMARASMLRSTLSKKYGNEHSHRLYALVNQAIHGDAKEKDKPWWGVDDPLWQAHKKLAGMSREDAMQHAVKEVARQRAMFSHETIGPNQGHKALQE